MPITPVGGGTEVQTKTLGSIDYYYLNDPNTGEDLSTHMNTFLYGRNATAVANQFLRLVNGITGTSTHGYVESQDGYVVYITAHATNTPVDQQLKVYNAGSLVETVDWSGSSSLSTALSTSIVAGTLSVELIDEPAGTPTRPNNPAVALFTRWKF